MLEHGRDALGLLLGVLMRFARRYLMAYAKNTQEVKHLVCGRV
jgi:hypothetical protein